MKTKMSFKRMSMFLAVMMGVCMTFALTSCGDDDEEEVPVSVAGVWELNRTTGYNQLGEQWDVYNDIFSGSKHIVFNPDGNGFEYNYKECRLLSVRHFSYSVKGNNLTVNYSDGAKYYQTVSVSAGQLVFKDSDVYKANETYTIETFHCSRVNPDADNDMIEIMLGASWEAYRVTGHNDKGAQWDKNLDPSKSTFVFKFSDNAKGKELRIKNGNQESAADFVYVVMGKKLVMDYNSYSAVTEILSLTVNDMTIRHTRYVDGVKEENIVHFRKTLNY